MSWSPDSGSEHSLFQDARKYTWYIRYIKLSHLVLISLTDMICSGTCLLYISVTKLNYCSNLNITHISHVYCQLSWLHTRNLIVHNIFIFRNSLVITYRQKLFISFIHIKVKKKKSEWNIFNFNIIYIRCLPNLCVIFIIIDFWKTFEIFNKIF